MEDLARRLARSVADGETDDFDRPEVAESLRKSGGLGDPAVDAGRPEDECEGDGRFESLYNSADLLDWVWRWYAWPSVGGSLMGTGKREALLFFRRGNRNIDDEAETGSFFDGWPKDMDLSPELASEREDSDRRALERPDCESACA